MKKVLIFLLVVAMVLAVGIPVSAMTMSEFCATLPTGTVDVVHNHGTVSYLTTILPVAG
jgi:hypothetical protein